MADSDDFEITVIPAEPLAEAAQGFSSEAEIGPQIAALAYELWLQRGCPIGSPEEDWYEAERQMLALSQAAPDEAARMLAAEPVQVAAQTPAKPQAGKTAASKTVEMPKSWAATA